MSLVVVDSVYVDFPIYGNSRNLRRALFQRATGGFVQYKEDRVIVKALSELGKTREKFAQLVFGILVIDYVPRNLLVESKSLKLHLASYRNHGGFHEECTVGIGKTLAALLAPYWLRIAGFWYPRGGMPIDVFWQTGRPPAGVFVPELGVPTYRGR